MSDSQQVAESVVDWVDVADVAANFGVSTCFNLDISTKSISNANFLHVSVTTVMSGLNFGR